MARALVVALHAGSYELHPPNAEYAVWLLSIAGSHHDVESEGGA